MKSARRLPFTLLSMTFSEVVFTKLMLACQFFVGNSHSKFHDNPNGLVADRRSKLTDGRDRHTRRSFLQPKDSPIMNRHTKQILPKLITYAGLSNLSNSSISEPHSGAI
jgi:hypothetical protein